MRIDLAYCSELDRIVDIDEACLEFIAQDTVKKFTFLCSDPICRESEKKYGVPVSAINYTKIKDDRMRRPHYRGYPDEHIPECMWIQLDAILAEERFSILRRNLAGMHRLFTRFIIPENVVNDSKNQIYIEQIKRIINDKDESSRRNKLFEYVGEFSATATSLDSLVNCYEQLKEKKILDQEITIKGYGLSNYNTIFRHIKCGVKNNFYVYYGGARLNKNYFDSGFTFTFIDILESMPISFNVSPEHLKNRFGIRLIRIIDELEKNKKRNPYVKIYWIGNLEKTEDGFNATFKNLAHVVFRIAYPSTK